MGHVSKVDRIDRRVRSLDTSPTSRRRDDEYLHLISITGPSSMCILGITTLVVESTLCQHLSMRHHDTLRSICFLFLGR